MNEMNGVRKRKPGWKETENTRPFKERVLQNWQKTATLQRVRKARELEEKIMGNYFKGFPWLSMSHNSHICRHYEVITA
jgi:hypothetical protein